VQRLTLDPATLVEMPGNENVMDPSVYRSLVRFIRERGFKEPILVRLLPDGRHGIVGGVHRRRAAVELGLPLVPCDLDETIKTDEEAKIVRIGMNRHRGDLDLSAVGRTLAEIIAEGVPINEATLSGYSEEEVRALVESARGGPSPDELMAGAPPPPPPQEREDDGGAGKTVVVLEVPFSQKQDHDRARRALRRAGGGDLARGLLSLIDGED